MRLPALAPKAITLESDKQREKRREREGKGDQLTKQAVGMSSFLVGGVGVSADVGVDVAAAAGRSDLKRN